MSGHCLTCGNSLEGKKKGAKYCNRSCYVRDTTSGEIFLCSRCKQPTHLSGFSKKGDYFSTVCKKCIKTARKKKYSADHPKRENLSLAEKMERHRTATKVHKKKNPERVRADRSKRRALERGCDRSLTPSEWVQILVDFDYECVYCGAPWEHMDHFVPLSKGGTHTKDNVVPACAPCNFSKGDRMPLDWINLFLREKQRG